MGDSNHRADRALVALGKTIQQLRSGKGMSQQDLALASKLDQAYVNDIETGMVNMPLKNLALIAQALHVQTSEVLSMAQILLEHTATDRTSRFYPYGVEDEDAAANEVMGEADD